MADKDKKSVDPYEVFYNIFLCAAVVGLAVCVFMEMNSHYLYIKGRLFCGYTVGFCGGAALMGIRLLTLLNKSKWKFDLRTGLLTAAAVISLLFGISCCSADMRRSKVMDVLNLEEKTEDHSAVTALLTEYSEPVPGDPDSQTVIMDVFKVSGRFAKKIGTVDETYYSNRCVEADSYNYTYTDDGTLTLSCNYGYYGKGFVNLVYDSGSLTYIFKVK